MTHNKKIQILGTRGIPAKHGGFETFAQELAPYLVNNGWDVIVYCQEVGNKKTYETQWNGVRLVHIYIKNDNSFGSIIFDIKSTIHSLKQGGIALVLGYNTAFLSIFYRIFGKKSIMNMDGIEWKRSKWSFPFKAWFFINEYLGSWFSDHLIADHPEIKNHLCHHTNDKKISMIPYGAHAITGGNLEILRNYKLKPQQYYLVIARAEPENSILEIVRGYCNSKTNYPLVILGNYQADNQYHQKVMNEACKNVLFLGAIYNTETLEALRYFTTAYIHGHTVGGTNPSLVEALGSGNKLLCHDNVFNRWVCESSARYFSNITDICNFFDSISNEKKEPESRAIFEQRFQWSSVLNSYKNLLNKLL